MRRNRGSQRGSRLRRHGEMRLYCHPDHPHPCGDWWWWGHRGDQSDSQHPAAVDKLEKVLYKRGRHVSRIRCDAKRKYVWTCMALRSVPQHICYCLVNSSLVYNLFAPKCNLLGHSGAEWGRVTRILTITIQWSIQLQVPDLRSTISTTRTLKYQTYGYSVQIYDLLNSKNSLFEIYRDCEVPLKMKG